MTKYRVTVAYQSDVEYIDVDIETDEDEFHAMDEAYDYAYDVLGLPVLETTYVEEIND